MNIFQKACPECAAPNAVEALTCRCGYCFDPEATAGNDPAEYAQQQDRLYRDYLAARIEQAEAELIVAREVSQADPENTYKASGALLAEQNLNALRAEMKQLSLRISASPQRRPRVAPPAQKSAPQPIKAPIAKVESAKPMTKQVALPTSNESRPAASRASAAPVTQPKTTVAAQPNVATVKPPLPAYRAQPQRAVPAPRTTIKPDEKFRRLQAQKADAIARSKPAPAAQHQTPTVKPAPQKSATVRPAPKAAASVQIPALVVPPPVSTIDCPNCTAVVPADRVRCGCGYALAQTTREVPAVALDATALAILTEGISAGTTRRR